MKIIEDEFNFNGRPPRYYEDFSCTRQLTWYQAIGIPHYRVHESGDRSKLVKISIDGSEQLKVLSRLFPNSEPWTIELWFKRGEFQFRREYYDEVVLDFDSSNNNFRSINVF